MRYIADNDLHIHSYLSSCSKDPEQNTETILEYAKKTGLKTICLTDHFWDEGVDGASEWYAPQGLAHIRKALPLPGSEGIRFLFGCETDLNRERTLGISRETAEELDFIIIPTTHFHMLGYTLYDEERKTPETRAEAWVERLDRVFSMELPFHKVGIAHLACKLIAPERDIYLKTLDAIPEGELCRVFKRAAELGVGIELNSSDMNYAPEEEEAVLRIFKVAKAMGCKFYLGSDAHHPSGLYGATRLFERAIDALKLTENDKFII